MYSYGDILSFFYLLQISIGMLGNGLLIYLYSCHLIVDHKTRPIDLIVINLAFSNILMILVRGIPWAIQPLEVKILLDYIGCKILIYFQRVSLSLTLFNTCLLSVFQAITISSSNTRWTEFKPRAPKYIIPFCMLIWILIKLVHFILFFPVASTGNNSNSEKSRNMAFCSLSRYTWTISKYLIWKSLHEGVFVSGMVISSGYMISVLCRHRQQVQHSLGISLSPRSSPEIRATKIIILLVSLFLYFYLISFIFIISMNNSQDTKQWVLHVSVFINLCYPVFVPYVLISSDSQISNSCYVLKKMKKSCTYPPTSWTKDHRTL